MKNQEDLVMTKPEAIYLGSPQMYTSYYYVDRGAVGIIDDKDYVELRGRGQRSEKLTVADYAAQAGFDFSRDYVGNKTPATLTQLKFFSTVIDNKHRTLRALPPDNPHRDSIATIYDKLLWEHNEEIRNILKITIANLQKHPEASEIFCMLQARAEVLGTERLTPLDRVSYEAYQRYDGMPALVSLFVRGQITPRDLTPTETDFLASQAAEIYIAAVGPLLSDEALSLALLDFSNPNGWYQARGTATGDAIDGFAYRERTVARLLSVQASSTTSPDGFVLDTVKMQQQMQAYGFPILPQ